jgi:DNA polymerase III alpha subunit
MEYKQEMLEHFNISEGELKFGRDNRSFTSDKDNQCIHPSITSIKGLGAQDGQALYDIKDNRYSTFLRLYADIKPHINTGKMETLIKIGYFSEFGKTKYLIDCMELYNTYYNKKTLKVDKAHELKLDHDWLVSISEKATEKQYSGVNMSALILELSKRIKNEELPPKDIIDHELEVLGYINYRDPKSYNVMYVTEVRTNKYGTPFVTVYNVNNGITKTFKANKSFVQNSLLDKGNMISITEIKDKPQRRKDECGEWQVVGTEKVLESFVIL